MQCNVRLLKEQYVEHLHFSDTKTPEKSQAAFKLAVFIMDMSLWIWLNSAIVFGILAKCIMHVLSCNQAFKNPIKFVNYFDRGRIFFFKLNVGVCFWKMFAEILKKILKCLKTKILKSTYFLLLRGGLFGSKISSWMYRRNTSVD